MRVPILSLIALTIIQCRESEPNINYDSILGKWKVICISETETSTWQSANAVYIFNFTRVNGLGISLDRNSCSGIFDIPEKGKITIDWQGCTKVCCDSNYGLKLASLVPKLADYSINMDTLFLSGIGRLKLIKQP